ncbi:ABC transporter substrate-binding protein [Curtobacterium sp. L1-20]|uniref:ABC transporter substrate-binding protein n=1 Tax=Curtobacterium sp. L1-20 TaxID=3138181 RepID=UPI003B52E74D
MKKWFAAAAAAVTVAALLGGCSAGGSATTGDKDVTLTYGVWSQDDTMQKLIDEFERENPKIHVKLQVNPFADYWTKLQVGAQGGTAPDAFWMLGDHFQLYAANDQLLQLDDAVKAAKVDMSKYPKPLVDLFNYQGHQYGLPKDFDTIGLWYNKKLFDDAGVGYPTTSWTWSDVQAAAAKLTNPSTQTYGIAAPLNRQEGYYNTIAQAGGEVISKDGKTSGYDSAATQKGLQYWVDFIKKGQSPTLKQFADTEAVAQFENQKVAMYYGGSFYAQRFYENKTLRPNVDVTTLPKGEKTATVINGIQNVGYSKSKHPAELKKFLLFLGGKKAADIQAATGAVIPAYEGTQSAWVKSMPQFHLQSFLDQVPDSVVYPVSANTSVWNDLEDKDLTPAWQLQEPIKDAADKLATGMNKALKNE